MKRSRIPIKIAAALIVRLILSAGLLMALEMSKPPQVQPQVILTTKDYAPASDQEFSCSDTIRGFITFSEKKVGAHQLDATWFLPSGTVGQHAEIPLNFPPPGRQTAMVWLRLNSDEGGLLDPVRDGHDSVNDINSFNGDWQLDLTWDGKPLHHTKFKVHC